MQSRQIITTPRDGLIKVTVSGERDDQGAQGSIAEFLEHHRNSPARQILFDTLNAYYAGPPENLYARAAYCGAAMAPCKVAIVTDSLDSAYARFWRRGLIETGHETAVFTCEAEADAWLSSEAEADILFLA